MKIDQISHDFYSHFESNVYWREFKNTKIEYYYAEDELYVLHDKGNDTYCLVTASTPLEALRKTALSFNLPNINPLQKNRRGPKRKFDDEKRWRIQQLRKAGCSFSEISKEIGISKAQAFAIVNEPEVRGEDV